MNRRPLFLAGGLAAAIVIAAVAWYLASPLFIDEAVDEAFPFQAPSTQAIAQMSGAEVAAVEATLEAAIPDPQVLEQMPRKEQEAVQEKVMEAVAAMPTKAMDEPMPEAKAGTGTENTAANITPTAEMDQAEAGTQEATPEPVQATEPAVVAPTPQSDQMETPTPTPAAPVVVFSGQFNGVDAIHQGSGSATVYQLDDGSRILRFEDFDVTNGPGLEVILSNNRNVHLTRNIGDTVVLGKLKGNVGNQNYELPAGVDLSEYSVVVIYCRPFHVVFATATLSA